MAHSPGAFRAFLCLTRWRNVISVCVCAYPPLLSPLPYLKGEGRVGPIPAINHNSVAFSFLKTKEHGVSFAKRCVVYKEEPYFSGKRGAKSSAATASWLEAVDEFIIKRGLRNKTATKTGGEEIYNLESGPVT